MLHSSNVQIGSILASGTMSADVIETLWDVFAQKVPNTTAQFSRHALTILGMAATQKPDIIKSKLSLLVSLAFGAHRAAVQR